MLLYRIAVGFLFALVAGCGGSDADQVPPQTALETTTPQAQQSVKLDAASDEGPGKAIYAHYCGDCHDPGHGHPGTMRLAVRLGVDKSVLVTRTDLPPDYVAAVVRNGLQMMPPFRPSEISDAALETLVAYVAANFQSESEDVQ